MIDISDGTKQIWGEDPPLMEVCWTHHKSLSRRHWGDVPGFRGCEVGACWCWGASERSAGAQGGANICAGLHTHWLYCQPYTKKQLAGLCTTIIFPLLLLGVTCLCQTTKRGIVVLKSYNYESNPDQSNALCAIKHYVRKPSVPHSHGDHDHHHTPNPFPDCQAKWCVEYQAALPHPSSPSTILIHHPTPHPSPDCDAKWCV